jgi:hypothetical protein
MDVLSELGHDVGARQLSAVLFFLGEGEKIREPGLNSPYSRIVRESWVKEAQGQCAGRFVQRE